MEVYISFLTPKNSSQEAFEHVKGLNKFFMEEVQTRGYSLTLDPLESDIMLMLPTWEDDKECLDEYNAFKQEKMIVTNLNALDEVMRDSCQ